MKKMKTIIATAKNQITMETILSKLSTVTHIRKINGIDKYSSIAISKKEKHFVSFVSTSFSGSSPTLEQTKIVTNQYGL